MSVDKFTIRTCVLALAVVVLTVMAGPASAKNSKPTLEVLTVPAFVPFEIPSDKANVKVKGFDMDILAEVAQRAGFDYTVKTMTFSGIIPALQTQSADLALAGITITKKRDQVVDYSIPYYQSGLKIMVRKNEDDINSIDDLKGHSISTKIGSTSYEYLTNKFGDSAQIKAYPRSANMYMAVMIGAVDASVYDYPNAAYFVKTKGKGKVKLVGPLYEAQPYGIAFAQGSKWIKPANKALRSMMADGTYAQIYKKWFGQKPPKNWFKKASSEVTWK